MTIPFFTIDNEDRIVVPPSSAWDTATWAGRPCPGLVSVVPDTERKIDESNAPGQDGAQLRFQGLSAGVVPIEIMVWTTDQLSDLEELVALVCPKRSKRPPQPYLFDHPATAAAGITAIVCEKVTWFGPGPVPQTKVMKLACKEYLKPKKAIRGTPELNAPNLGGVPDAAPPGAPSKSAGKAGP